jgi:hypothetical protein
MKQEPKQKSRTAVEWLKPQIELMLMNGYKSYPNELEEVFEIAKEMEKQEQGYSEEEVLNIIDNYNETFKVDLILREDFNQWFEQFKNK